MTSYANGHLPSSVLGAIAGGHLRKDAAIRWNAMNYYRRSKGLATILPNGSMSSYRTFAQQVFLRNQWCARGACQNAAVPGTSNHGWGLAVDANNPPGVNATGAKFGYQKKWSDASWEPWHFKWAGFGSTYLGPTYPRTLKPGQWSRAVGKLKRALRKRGHKLGAGLRYGSATVKAVKTFQRNHGLKADGIVGPKTWAKLLK